MMAYSHGRKGLRKKRVVRRKDPYFQERLKTLHEAGIALARAESFDEMCFLAVVLGRSQLGFDRLGLWFFDVTEPSLCKGSFGVGEDGQIRDERQQRVPMKFPPMVERLDGRVLVAPDMNSPLYDDHNQVVGYGANAVAMLWDGDHSIGWLSIDNYFSRKPITDDDLEILVLYAATLGHLVSRHRAQQQALELAVQKERVRFLMEFISNFSHDFRTPLSIINTNLYLMERVTDAALRQSKQDGIRYQIALLEKYIEDIMTISRLEQIDMLTWRVIDFNDLITTVSQSFIAPAQERQLRMELDLAEPLPKIHASPLELGRAVRNLIENAFMYTDSGGVVHIRTRLREAYIMVEVDDNGCGIDEVHLPRVFEHFYRVDHSRPVGRGGTGLGLAIVQRIVQLHEGDIEVESEPGKGSLFRILLPALI
jgi:signal transduction histidine kinase